MDIFDQIYDPCNATSANTSIIIHLNFFGVITIEAIDWEFLEINGGDEQGSRSICHLIHLQTVKDFLDESFISPTWTRLIFHIKVLSWLKNVTPAPDLIPRPSNLISEMFSASLSTRSRFFSFTYLT